jgi:hypothetical protein
MDRSPDSIGPTGATGARPDEEEAHMAIGVIWHLPIDQQTYDVIHEKVHEAAVAKGMTRPRRGRGRRKLVDHRGLGLA